jgi:ABC-type glycerol-3-phosphate transport system permease component
MATDTMQAGKRKALIDPRMARILNRSLLYAVLVIGSVGTCFPFFWMTITSFKNYAEAIATPPTLFPKDWGIRISLVGQMLSRAPLVLILLLVWIALGIFFVRRIKDKVIAGICFVAYLALFFVLGNMSWLGHSKLLDLWQATVSRAGITLPPLFGNYVEAWGRAPFGFYFRNSIIISILTPLLIVVTSAPAAYAFARLRFPGKDVIFLLYLATMMIPPEVLLIPNFITISELGWKNTYLALVIPFTANVVSIFFLRQFFLSIPNDLHDAATIDGAGHLRFLVSIGLPLSRPALVSTGMFNFLSTWNALIWPLLVTDKESMRPIALGLASFSTEAGMQPQLYMAAATFSIVPVIVLFLFVQKQFIEGIARTGIK